MRKLSNLIFRAPLLARFFCDGGAWVRAVEQQTGARIAIRHDGDGKCYLEMSGHPEQVVEAELVADTAMKTLSMLVNNISGPGLGAGGAGGAGINRPSAPLVGSVSRGVSIPVGMAVRPPHPWTLPGKPGASTGTTTDVQAVRTTNIMPLVPKQSNSPAPGAMMLQRPPPPTLAPAVASNSLPTGSALMNAPARPVQMLASGSCPSGFGNIGPGRPSIPLRPSVAAAMGFTTGFGGPLPSDQVRLESGDQCGVTGTYPCAGISGASSGCAPSFPVQQPAPTTFGGYQSPGPMSACPAWSAPGAPPPTCAGMGLPSHNSTGVTLQPVPPWRQ